MPAVCFVLYDGFCMFYMQNFKITLHLFLLDRKGLLCVAEALAYVESPIKVDNYFCTFCL
jgi:hypothetical protein